ncbi:hypothetical protein CcaCcLH18_08479 [Colletotrichum camelliae]|nr:hypothetical protein CcaCcLH18_08479 [Colletotrichum camelliae]
MLKRGQLEQYEDDVTVESKRMKTTQEGIGAVDPQKTTTECELPVDSSASTLCRIGTDVVNTMSRESNDALSTLASESERGDTQAATEETPILDLKSPNSSGKREIEPITKVDKVHRDYFYELSLDDSASKLFDTDVEGPDQVFSDNESIFSTAGSESSKSSFQGNELLALREFITTIFIHEEALKDAFIHGMGKESIGVEAMTELANRALRLMGKGLQSDATNEEQRFGAQRVRKDSKYIAYSLRKTCDPDFAARRLVVDKPPMSPEDQQQYLLGMVQKLRYSNAPFSEKTSEVPEIDDDSDISDTDEGDLDTNLTLLFYCEGPPDFSDISDPDVSGIGVSIGFVGTGCLMILFLIIYYVFAFDPNLDPLCKPGQASRDQKRPNNIDVTVLRRVRWAFSTLGVSFTWLLDERKGVSIERGFNKCILAMGDIQIATGLAVLISGYHELPRMISAYHWMMIVYTAWFSSVAHLAALSHLRTYYANHPERSIWRLVLIFCVVTMLSVAMFINTPIKVKMDASDRIQLADYRAICLFNESKLSNGSVPEVAMLADTIFSVSMLAFGLIIRTVKMSRGVSRWTGCHRSFVRSKLAFIVKGEDIGLRRVLGHHVYTLFIARPLAASWILGRLYLELCSSFLAEVAWVVITASWGLKQLLLIRAESPEDENSWSFGQVAAVVLFISPLCLVFEQFFNPDAADTRHSGATRPHSDDLLEIQPSEPEGLDARREPIEWIRLVNITACWDAPSSRATVHLFIGFNFLLMVYAFNDYVVFRAFVKMMTWFFVYQPIQAALVLLLGMELEQTELWIRSHALRRTTVVGFVGTGWLIVLLLNIYYIFVFNPDLDPLRKPSEPSKRCERPNVIDVAVLQRVRSILSIIGIRFMWLFDGRKGTSLETAFNEVDLIYDWEWLLRKEIGVSTFSRLLLLTYRKFILAMSDIQLATGLAVLISGFHELPRSISAYHWMVIVYTAWFSSVTHLAALSHLRNYYANHLRACVWRLVLMIFVILMLITAMVFNTPIKVLLASYPGPWNPTGPVVQVTEQYNLLGLIAGFWLPVQSLKDEPWDLALFHSSACTRQN